MYILTGSVWVKAESGKGEKQMTVSAGKQVSIEYTLKLDDKSVIDTNVGSEPLTFVQGSHQIIPGLEKELDGMKIGDSKEVSVKPEDAYGPVNEAAFREVEKTVVPEDALKVDARLQGRDANGQAVHARVAEVKDKTVLLDFNHPLAGKILHFDVKVLNIQEAAAK
jgi:FKBP-type peptidyl-prolyl cis-trans isomerase SlyD